MARETAIVQIAGTFSRSGWSQVGRYGRRAIIRIQNAGIPVAMVHLIRSHVWRFLIEVKRNWSVAIAACRGGCSGSNPDRGVFMKGTVGYPPWVSELGRNPSGPAYPLGSSF